MKYLRKPIILGLTPLFVFIFAVSAHIFYHYPQIDILFSGLFFVDGKFVLAGTDFGRVIFFSVNYLSTALIVILPLLLVFLTVSKKKVLFFITKPILIYMALVLILGPGLVVNEVLKNNFGRARPETVSCFLGPNLFTAAFQPSNECERNCSFVSGHAAFGFYWTALAFTTANRVWRRRFFDFGLLLGAFIGFVRILQGRHFLSDVVFSFFFVYSVAAIVSFLLQKFEPKILRG
jgi:lipid A 4'-phosphatase